MSGKGSKQRPYNHTTFNKNWDKIFGKTDKAYESENPLERPFELWPHYCEKERASMRVMKGEACNWCGKFEDGTTD